jgi:hypothetical protein
MWDLLRSHTAICIDPGGGVGTVPPPPRALLPGSFNPLHHGHRSLAAIAAARLQSPVHFELSITNADKPVLPREEVELRVSQFATIGPVWLTRAATFVEKAALFPGAAFVVGWDTAIRLVDPKYYGGFTQRDEALRAVMRAGCRFVVAGRMDESGAFRIWDGSCATEEFAELFSGLTERDFRVDVSSRAIRAGVARG